MGWWQTLISFLRVKVVWLCYIGMYTMEGLVVMILLVDTQLECGFIPFYQQVIMPTQVVLSFVTQFASGIFTDQTAPYAHRILQVTCGICLIVDPLMFLFGKQSQWVVLVLFSIRYTSLVQLNNSVGKVLKLHLSRTKVPEEEQLPIVANVSVFSDCAGRLFAVIFGFSLPLILVDYAHVSFPTLKYFCLGTIFALDCAAFTTSLFIPSSYINGTKLMSMVEDDVEKDAEFTPKEESSGCASSTKSAFVEFFGTRLLWMATLQIVFGILVMAIMTVILRFELASGSGGDGEPTRKNLCNMKLRNLLLQDLVGDGIRALSAVFYQFILTNMRPWYFFSRVWFMLMTVVALLAGSTYWNDMPAALSSVVLGLLLAITYMVLVFTNSAITAIVPETIYGFTFAMQGVLNTLMLLIPSGISALEPPRWAVTTIILAVIGGTMLWNGSIIYFNRRSILKLDQKVIAKGRLESCIWGYPIEYEAGFTRGEEEELGGA